MSAHAYPGQPPAPKRSPILWILLGIGALFFVIALIGVVTAAQCVANSPEGGVRMNNEMDRYALEYIEKHKLLEPSEQVVAYYDVTIALDGTEAAILTTERVLYHKQGRTTAIDLADIDDVQHRNEGLVGDVIEIKSKKGQRLKIEIAPMNQGESFVNALRDGWKRKATLAPKSPQ